MIEHYLSEFGRSIGVENLTFDQYNCAKISLERAGELYIQRKNGSVIFYILKTYEIPSMQIYFNALKVAHAQERYPFTLHPIAHNDNQVGFLTKCSESKCDLPFFNNVLSHFRQLAANLDNL